MAASVLNSPRAVEASVQVVRAFVQLRQMLASNDELARKLLALEKNYNIKFTAIFVAIHQLMPPIPRKCAPSVSRREGRMTRMRWDGMLFNTSHNPRWADTMYNWTETIATPF